MTDEDKKYHPVEQPDEIPIREREDAMGAYLMMFAALAAGLPLPIINLIAALVYFYINKGKSRFVRFHSLQSLFFADSNYFVECRIGLLDIQDHLYR